MAPEIGPQFIELTKYKHLQPSPQNKGAPQPPLETAFNLGGELHDLPAPDSIQNEFKQLVDQRASLRNYQDAPISQEELAYLLWCTQGVKSVMGKHYATKRTVPSAGARHAFETLVLANRVEGLPPGVYRYLALEHKLEEFLLRENIAGEIADACLGQTMIKHSAATFVWVADIEQMTWRYVQRGYRYIFLDAGHVCQNLYLAAEALGCGVCAIGAFDDDLLNALLDLDGETRFAVYLAALGKRE